jgi:hypothetical protein
MVDDLPNPIVLDDPDFLGLVVVLLFLVHKTVRIRKWFAIDSNFKQPILNRSDRVPNELRPDTRCPLSPDSTSSRPIGSRSSLVTLLTCFIYVST